jgi:hypothetical protein
VNVYDVPGVNPATIIGLVDGEYDADTAAGLEVKVTEEIELPPFDPGSHEMAA